MELVISFSKECSDPYPIHLQTEDAIELFVYASYVVGLPLLKLGV